MWDQMKGRRVRNGRSVKMKGTDLVVALLLLLLILGANLLPAPSALAACSGLKGDALQQCLQKAPASTGPPTMLFIGPDGHNQKVETAAVTRSIESVCQQAKQDGVYTAYRSGQDRARNRIWKEVECRSGHVEGLWKEHFPEDDMTIVLYYDTAGNSVKQALYIGGQLIREQPISAPTRK
jgi:hypothetical protein